MNEQNTKQTATLKQEPQDTSHPSTADIARSMSQPTASTDNPAPAHRVPGPDSSAGQGPAPLLVRNESEQFRTRWTDIQAGFVDEPRKAVEQADTLVAEVMKRLAETFADERSKLEAQWGQGDNVSTEDLRQALRRYRSFFDRLLSL